MENNNGSPQKCDAQRLDELLAEVAVYLEEMYDLALAAASESCSDEERAVLQEKLVELRKQIGRVVDGYPLDLV